MTKKNIVYPMIMWPGGQVLAALKYTASKVILFIVLVTHGAHRKDTIKCVLNTILKMMLIISWYAVIKYRLTSACASALCGDNI